VPGTIAELLAVQAAGAAAPRARRSRALLVDLTDHALVALARKNDEYDAASSQGDLDGHRPFAVLFTP